MRCALLTLTNFREGPVGDIHNVKHLFWGDVHNELEIASRANPDASVDEILRQFADFLKLKGLAYMSIPTVSSDSLKQFIGASQLRKSMEDILASLKTSQHLKPLLTRKHILFEDGKRDAYLGIHGSRRPPSFYIGFALYKTPTPKMKLYIERSLVGKRTDVTVSRELKKSYRRREFANGLTWFVFERPVDKQLNGDAEAIKRWFHQTSKLVLLTLGKK